MMSFSEWLLAQRSSDPDKMMPYAPLYDVADALAEKFGDAFDLPMFVDWFRDTLPADKEVPCSEALVMAEANWRVDSLVMAHPEDMEAAVEEVADPIVEEVKPKKAVKPAVTTTPAVLKRDPVIRPLPCGFRGVDGNQCASDAVLGGARCARHGGLIMDPDVRRSLLITAYARLISNTDLAVETLVDVMIDGRNEIARVSASKELLDRAGMTAEQQVTFNDTTNLETEDEKSARVIDTMRSRLDATRDRLRLQSIPVESEEAG